MKSSVKFNSELMGAKQVHDYLNGLFELDKIIKLMQTNEIKTFEKGLKRELVTKKMFVDHFIDSLFEAPYVNKSLGIDTMPRKLLTTNYLTV